MIASSPCLVTVGVVDALEVIDVAHDQAARLTSLLMGFDEQGQHTVELRTIGDLGHGVFGHLGVQGFALLFERCLGLSIVQQNRRALHFAIRGMNGNRMQVRSQRVVPGDPLRAADDESAC